MQLIIVSSPSCYENLEWNIGRTSIKISTFLCFGFTLGLTKGFSGSNSRVTFFSQILRAYLLFNRGLIESKPESNIFLTTVCYEHLGSFGPTKAELGSTKPLQNSENSYFFLWAFLPPILIKPRFHHLPPPVNHPIHQNTNNSSCNFQLHVDNHQIHLCKTKYQENCFLQTMQFNMKPSKLHN